MSSEIYSLAGASPEIDPSAWVAPGARVIGHVILRENASVWFNAVLRGDNEPIEVGPRANVQDGCVLHTDIGCPMTIGADCTVGHNVILHGCSIGAGALIGMGATILNNACIGAGSLVGANALVTEGKSFPEGSLIIGAPARVARALRPEEIDKLIGTAAGYVSNARRFREGLLEIMKP
ncbi:MAG: gamma carbonic anhydrase family protein [Rhodobacteraceae bacterium]|nr:gamma carbonic anhydrase family protein [Paracoccaceae bacterium]